MLISEIVYGVFKEEIKNRFLCIVNIYGADTLCCIPSSCRLSNFIKLTNRTVMLQPVRNKEAKTKYSIYAVKYRRSYVPVNLSNSNKIVEEYIEKRNFSFLGKRTNLFREKTIDKYKTDLYIADTDTIIEIKKLDERLELCYEQGYQDGERTTPLTQSTSPYAHFKLDEISCQS